MPTQKRDNEYIMQRLKKERPQLYRDVLAGKLTVNKARQLHGGLGGIKTPLSQLKNAWNKAGTKERNDFLSWAGITPMTMSTAAPAPAAVKAAFNADGKMEAWAQRRVVEIVARRSISPGDLASELGLSRLDQSVITAAKNGTSVRSPAVRSAVEAWLKRYSGV